MTVGVGSALAAATTFGIPVLIMAAVVLWELKTYPV
jgi:hypothetical protein